MVRVFTFTIKGTRINPNLLNSHSKILFKIGRPKMKKVFLLAIVAFLIALSSGCATASTETIIQPFTQTSNSTNYSQTTSSQVNQLSTTTVPQPIKEPDKIVFNGKGDDVSPQFNLGQGMAIVSMTHNGSRNFIVHLLNGAGELSASLANAIGVYNGSVAMGVSTSNYSGVSPGSYELNIQADGNWTIIIEQPRPNIATAIPISFSGNGDGVSSFFALETGLTTFSMNHDGRRNFIVHLCRADGIITSSLVNSIGSYNGKQAVAIKSGDLFGNVPGMYSVSVIADGNWSITISHSDMGSQIIPTINVTPRVQPATSSFQPQTSLTTSSVPSSTQKPNTTIIPSTIPASSTPSVGYGLSRNNPVPIGQSLVTSTGISIRVTVFNDGPQAWNIIQPANMFNNPPPSGMKYILVTVDVKNISSQTEPYSVDYSDFSLVGSSNVSFTSYDLSTSVVLPKSGIYSELDKSLYHDGETEGSIHFTIPQNETNLVLVYSPSFLSGGNRYFEVK